jgi:serine/threonine protein kinase
MEFVPYNRFKDVKYIAEGGFSRIYKSTWIDGPTIWNNNRHSGEMTVALKELNNSKYINPKELNEVQ